MHKLNQKTTQVIEEINCKRTASAVTKHRRFTALITPCWIVRSSCLSYPHGRLADELHRRATDPDPDSHSGQEIAQRARSHYQGRS
jgi:hypothetical protein